MVLEEKQIYVYTTRTYDENGMLKVGFCNAGRVRERVNEQFGSSNPERPIIRWIKDLPEGITDHNIHKQMLKNGIRRVEDGTGNEWFYAKLEDVKIAYNQVVYGSSRTENYSLRKEQYDAIQKAKKWFKREYPEEVIKAATHEDRFLLNAKMRFGKCFTGVHIAKELECHNTLIVTYKPEVISEWIDTVNTHVDFRSWTGIRAKRKDNNSNDPCLSSSGEFPSHADGPIVLCVSLQDLFIDQNGETKDRLKNVLSTSWDLIIFDEVHFGSRTERAKYILDEIKWNHRLDLSGTPFRLLNQDDFCSQQIFTYSYLDEQVNKKEEIARDPEGKEFKVYREMPDLDISTIEITEEDIKEQTQSFTTDDLDFSLNELFRAKDDGTFYHEDAVGHFLDGLTKSDHGARAISIYGKLGEKLNMPPRRHSVWWLRRVNSVKALASKLGRHPYFSKFEIINVAGNSSQKDGEDTVTIKDKREIEEKIRDVDGRADKNGTITLTAGRFLTGVTIKEWNSILVLNDVESAESYYQAIFRVQSANVDKNTRDVLKPKSWVFDFAISRCLRISYQYAEALADQLDQLDNHEQKYFLQKDHLTKTITGLCDTLNIKRFYEGDLTFNPTTARDIFDALNLVGARVSLAKRITSDALVDFTALKLLELHPDVLKVLEQIKGYRTQDISFGIEDFVKIGAEAENLKKAKNSKDDETDEELAKENEEFIEDDKDKERKKKKQWYATQIKRLAICMADFIYMTYFREYNIEHVINTKDSDFFKIVTGISKDDFSKLCDLGFIKREPLNRIVREFRCQEESSLSPDEYILEHLIKKVA